MLKDDSWVEFGGERIWPVDFTAGGAPIGLTERESREIEARLSPEAGWAVAKNVLMEVARASGVRDVRDAVDYVRFLGRGLFNDVYSASVLLGNREESVVVKLRCRDAPIDRDEIVRREARLLRWLVQESLPFRVPRAIAEMPTVHGVAVVQEWMSGSPVDLRADRFRGGKPWQFVARIAAALHALPMDEAGELLPRYPTRRDHDIALSQMLAEVDGSEGDAARAWVREHYPPAEPACLLHGDLLGQNLQLTIDDDVPAVVDWAEALVGDPAYELAIVTRGVRRPFGRTDGLQRLIDAYNQHATLPVTVAEVQLQEVILLGGFYLSSVATHGRNSPYAESQRNVLRAMLSRVAN